MSTPVYKTTTGFLIVHSDTRGISVTDPKQPDGDLSWEMIRSAFNQLTGIILWFWKTSEVRDP